MFDKLEGLVDRLDTVLQELNDPDVEAVTPIFSAT